MSPPIKKESLDWEPLTTDQDMNEESKALVGKLSGLKVVHLTRIDCFNVWLIDITHALKSAGLGDYLSAKERVSMSCHSTGKQWMIVSKQIASWMKHHMKDTLNKVLRARGEALTFADTFIDKAKKMFGAGHRANELRLDKFLSIKPADFVSMSQFVTAYEASFILLRSHGIRLSPYPALLAFLLHIKVSHKQVYDIVHHMLETEIDFEKSTIAKEQDGRAASTHGVVTVAMFQDFASRTATLLADEDV